MQQLFTNPECARVFLQAISVLVSIVGVVALWWQIAETRKRVTEASVRSFWAQLRSDRRQMDAEVTKIDIKQGDLERRREQLAKGIYTLSKLSEALEVDYPDAFPESFKREADKERETLKVA
jgi:hypothetical protein